jgi:hypothetical protein
LAVALVQVFLNGLDQLFDVEEAAAPNSLIRELAEPALNQVQPPAAA